MKKIRWGLRWKIAALTGASSTLIALFLVVSYSVQMHSLLTAQLLKRGQAVATELANNLAYLTFQRDTKGLEEAAQATLTGIPDVAYVVLRDRDGNVLAQHKDPSISQAPAVPAAAAAEKLWRETSAQKVPVLDLAYPIYYGGERKMQTADLDPVALLEESAGAATKRERYGSVQVGFFRKSLQDEISDATLKAIGIGLLVLVGSLLAAVWVTRLLTSPLERLSEAAAGIARGDLRQTIEVSADDEIGALAASFQSMAGSLRTMLADLRSAASEVQREASTILATATQQSAMANGQATAISQTSSTVTEIAETSRQATEHADSVIQVTQKSEELSREGQRAVQESLGAMEKLGEQVKAIALSITELSERTLQIGDIIGSVKDLAEQSNLLALNASIEAAKAGEHGKGFAVVAMEMRNLAEQSKVAAGQIRAIIGEVQKGTRAAVAATEEGSKRAHSTMALAQGAGGSIEGLAGVIKESSMAARQIAGNTRQQTIGVEQILSAITQLSSSMNETLTGTRGIERVAGSLTTLSQRLTDLTNRYHV